LPLPSAPASYPPSLHDALPIWADLAAFLDEDDVVVEPLAVHEMTEAAQRQRIADRLLPLAFVGADEPRHVVLERGGEAERVVHRSEEHTSELQSRENLVCRLLL